MAALTQEQYYKKLLATCPDWFLDDIDASIYRGQLMGMAAVLNKLHQVALDHKTETFITESSQEFLEVHADERVIPSLGFIGENRVDQVQKIGSRASLDKIKDIVDRIIFDGTSEVHEGFLLDPSDPDGFPGRYLDLPYDDSEEQIIDWLNQRNVFTIVIDPQSVPSFNFINNGGQTIQSHYDSFVFPADYPGFGYDRVFLSNRYGSPHRHTLQIVQSLANANSFEAELSTSGVGFSLTDASGVLWSYIGSITYVRADLEDFVGPDLVAVAVDFQIDIANPGGTARGVIYKDGVATTYADFYDNFDTVTKDNEAQWDTNNPNGLGNEVVTFIVTNDAYCNRNTFAGSFESSVTIGNAIIESMQVYKAAGFRFRVIELTNGDYES